MSFKGPVIFLPVLAAKYQVVDPYTGLPSAALRTLKIFLGLCKLVKIMTAF